MYARERSEPNGRVCHLGQSILRRFSLASNVHTPSIGPVILRNLDEAFEPPLRHLRWHLVEYSCVLILGSGKFRAKDAAVIFAWMLALYKFRVTMHRTESPCIEREICTAFVCHLFCRFEGPREVPKIVAFVCHLFCRFEGPREVPKIVAFVCHLFCRFEGPREVRKIVVIGRHLFCRFEGPREVAEIHVLTPPLCHLVFPKTIYHLYGSPINQSDWLSLRHQAPKHIVQFLMSINRCRVAGCACRFGL